MPRWCGGLLLSVSADVHSLEDVIAVPTWTWSYGLVPVVAAAATASVACGTPVETARPLETACVAVGMVYAIPPSCMRVIGAVQCTAGGGRMGKGR